jgi:hypothetical protein
VSVRRRVVPEEVVMHARAWLAAAPLALAGLVLAAPAAYAVPLTVVPAVDPTPTPTPTTPTPTPTPPPPVVVKPATLT